MPGAHDGAMRVSVREAVFGLLRDFGLNTVFGNPGSTELPMFRDFPADFRYVLGLQESVVVARLAPKMEMTVAEAIVG
jgi:benzoylformate decarboxylase